MTLIYLINNNLPNIIEWFYEYYPYTTATFSIINAFHSKNKSPEYTAILKINDDDENFHFKLVWLDSNIPDVYDITNNDEIFELFEQFGLKIDNLKFNCIIS